MSNSKITKIFSGCGGVMFAVCVAAAVIHFNDWMKDHAWAVTYIMYISGAGAMVCSLIWLFTKKSSNQSSMNPTATSTHAPISINISPNLSQTISQIPLPHGYVTETSAVPRQQREPSIPRLSVIDATMERLDCSSQMITKSHTGTHGLVLWVENPPAAEGERAKDVRGVAAIICFTNDVGLTGRVDRAYWLGHLENQITIEVGQTKGIVIGLIHPIFWTFYSNKRRQRPSPRPTMQQIRNMAESLSVPLEPETLPLMTELEAVITIISVETGYMITKAAYRIIRGDNQSPFYIEEIILPV